MVFCVVLWGLGSAVAACDLTPQPLPPGTSGATASPGTEGSGSAASGSGAAASSGAAGAGSSSGSAGSSGASGTPPVDLGVVDASAGIDASQATNAASEEAGAEPGFPHEASDLDVVPDAPGSDSTEDEQ